MPQDVSTRWNSTYQMLEFALKYRTVIDMLTSERALDLRKYEVDKEEWILATQLCKILKVSTVSMIALRACNNNLTDCDLIGIQRRNRLLFKIQSIKYHECNTCDRPFRRSVSISNVIK